MPPYKKIFVSPGFGEIKIFFDENLYYNVDEETVKELVGAGFANGDLVGANLDDLVYGIIVVRYNPTRISADAAMRGVNRIVEYIATCAA